MTKDELEEANRWAKILRQWMRENSVFELPKGVEISTEQDKDEKEISKRYKALELWIRANAEAINELAELFPEDNIMITIVKGDDEKEVVSAPPDLTSYLALLDKLGEVSSGLERDLETIDKVFGGDEMNDTSLVDDRVELQKLVDELEAQVNQLKADKQELTHKLGNEECKTKMFIGLLNEMDVEINIDDKLANDTTVQYIIELQDRISRLEKELNVANKERFKDYY